MVVSTAHIDAHARIILQKFIQRELIKISGEIIGDAYEDSTDVFDLLDKKKIAVKMISLGASDINISLVLEAVDIEKAVKLVHEQILMKREGARVKGKVKKTSPFTLSA